MVAILFASMAGGLVANRALMSSDIHHVILRYPLSVLASFLTFVLTMRIWLSYLSRAYSPASRTIEFDDDNTQVSSKKDKENSYSLFDWLADFGGVDSACGCLLIIFLFLITAIGGSAAVLVYEAPVILAEIAFQFFLASGLIRSARKIDSPDWIGSVLANTWKPFAFVLVASIIFGVVAEFACNDPTGIPQMIDSCGN